MRRHSKLVVRESLNTVALFFRLNSNRSSRNFITDHDASFIESIL